ncbi:MAG TPA: YkuS family protein [Clostridiales bacterium]|nr:YkuS family protein [Clostridiales bacterium]
MKNIAVQKGLTQIADHLTEAGYKVFEFDTRQKGSKDFFRGFDAVVMMGMNDNIMGIQTTNTKTPFIEARGMTPEEVQKTIEDRTKH